MVAMIAVISGRMYLISPTGTSTRDRTLAK
jgi:hypothetical protein